MILRYNSILFLFLWSITGAFGQVSDSFSDGDFTNNPTWTGNTTEYIVDTEELRLNASVAGESYLTTSNSFINSTTWAFKVRMGFNPSSTSKTYVYLVSDQADLNGSLNGYYVLIGNTSDEVSLYRQDGTTSTEIIDGLDDSVDVSSVNVNIRVFRDETGNWELFTDLNNGNPEYSEGSVFDDTYTNTNFFGFNADYIASRVNLFFFDDVTISKPLDIDTVFASAENKVTVRYNQPIDLISGTNSLNYSIDNSITIADVVRDVTNKSEVVVTTNQNLGDNTFNITINNVSDELTETPVVSPLVRSFDYINLTIENIITVSETVVRVDFNQPVNEALAEDPANYSFNQSIGNPLSATRDDVNTDLVDLTIGTSLQEGLMYNVTVANLQNEIGNSTLNDVSPDFEFIIPILIESAFATSANDVSIIFNKDLDPSTATNTANYTLGGVENPQNASLVNDTTVSITFASPLENGLSTITINGVKNTDNSLTANNLSVQFSYLIIEITSITETSDSEITLLFNQEIDSISARNTANYSVNFSIGNPASVNYDKSEPNQVILNFANLVNNKYLLSVSDISNRLFNSTLSAVDSSFQIITATNASDILISEIFADPTPVIGLPSTEFVEIYNRTLSHINLENFEFSGGTLPDFTLAPGAYLILSGTGGVGDYAGFGDVLGIPSFPGLTNSGRDLVLKDNLGNQIDSVNYDNSWYRDATKANGGYSLELINPELPCSGTFNWIASSNASGGTPGTQNSVFDDSPDVTPPVVSSVTVVEEDSLLIIFNEVIELSGISQVDFSLSGNTITAIETIDEGFGKVAIKLESPLISEAFYILNYERIQDCSGNSTPGNFEFYYDVLPPSPSSVIINSFDEITLIFSEPLNEGIAETEVNYTADNGLGEPGSAQLNNDVPSEVTLSFEAELQIGTSYTLTITNLADTLGNAISNTSIQFQYEQSIDSVAVIAPNLLDVYFNQSVDETSAENRLNYSLEELDNPASIALDQQNTSLVHLAFSDNIRENSERSLFLSNIRNVSNELISTPEFIFTYDTRAPSLESAEAIDSTQLLITFTEIVKKASAEVVSHYELNSNIFPDSVLQQNDQSQLIAYFRNPFEKEVEQQITVRNVADLFGNSSSSTINRRIEFTYDPLPPRLDSLIQISLDSILLDFSEPLENSSALNLINYELEGSTNPSSIFFTNGDSSQVTLLLATDLSEIVEQSITIANLSDRNGNLLTNPITFIFNAFNPEVNQLFFSDPDTLIIGFSKPMESSQLVDLANYSISNTPPINSISLIDDKKVSLNFSESFSDKQSGELSISQGITATIGNPLVTTDFSILFDDLFDTLLIINDNTIALQFDQEIATPSLGNFTIMGDMSQPQLVAKDIDNPEIIRLVFGEPISQNVELTIRWENIYDIFNNPIPGGLTRFHYDTAPPSVIGLKPGLFNQLTVQFSESLDEISATAFNHYRLRAGNILPVISTELIQDSNVAITFEQNLVDLQSYSLEISRIEDITGNVLMDTVISFLFEAPEIPSTGDILITEVMADPSPSAGLPEVEYIELYNASDKTFDLSTISFADASTVISIPNFELAPRTYVTITGTSGAGLFQGNVLTLTGFPSLGNTGDSLTIININSIAVDQVVYNIDWYNDTDKDDGGFSLERISLLESCNIEANWTASYASDGGTPGTENSVSDNTPDAQSPEITSFTFDGDDLIINFSEPMDTTTFLATAFTIEPAVIISNVNSSEDRLSISVSGDFALGNIYKVTITGFTDCTGNLLLENTVSIGKGETPALGDLIITEIMADPEPTQGQPISEYIELYNNSNKLLTIEEVILADRTGETTIGPATMEAGGYLILVPTSSTELFSSVVQVVGVTSFPSLGNSSDSISIRNTVGESLDVVEYSIDWYNDADKDDGGFSLERISLLESCNIEANWTASNASDGGTPGAENSVSDNTPDAQSPEITSFTFDGDDLIINFSEPMDTTTFNTGIFSFEPEVTINSVSANPNRKSVAISAMFLDGLTYQLTVLNVNDCTGNLLTENTVLFGRGKTPGFGELIITEIMADPEPSQGLPITEYLEILNTTDELIKLDEIILADGTGSTPLPSGIILPSEYLVLTPSGSERLFNDNIKAIGVSGWLSLNNGGEKLSLNVNGDEIFSVIYSDDWYDDPFFDGGRSLEMVDVSNFCGEDNNWTAASEDIGGTPGFLNSMTASNPDLTGPELLNVFAINAQSIELIFDEKLIFNRDDLQINTTPELQLENFTVINERGNLISLTSSIDLEPKTTYTISITGFTDCKGNRSLANEVNFVLAEEGAKGDLLLNELLFNPRSGGTDFVEIYNVSDKFINLNGWAFANSDFFESDNSRLITEENLIIPPSGYLAFTEDKGIIRSEYPNNVNDLIIEINDLPTFPDSEGTVILIDPSGNLIEQFDYSDDLQSSLLDDDNGVSLERISFTTESNAPENWKSAASSVGFATPGEQNSQVLLSNVPNSTVSISPKVFIPDGTGSSSSQTFTTINYELDNGGSFANISIYNANGQFIKEIANGELLSSQGFFRWDGLNENGNIVKVGYYIVLFELYDNNGNTNVIKETVVVGTQL